MNDEQVKYNETIDKAMKLLKELGLTAREVNDALWARDINEFRHNRENYDPDREEEAWVPLPWSEAFYDEREMNLEDSTDHIIDEYDAVYAQAVKLGLIKPQDGRP